MNQEKQRQIEAMIQERFIYHPNLFNEFPKDTDSWASVGCPHQWELIFENSDIILYGDSGYGLYFLITVNLQHNDVFKVTGGNKEIGYIVLTEDYNGELTIAKVIN